MSGRTIDVTTPDGTADAYLARPEGDGAHPGVLLIMDAFGLRPQIERMADRIAAQGYVVLAPNVLYRGGRSPIVPLEGLDDPERRGEIIAGIRPHMAALTPELTVRDGAAYLAALDEEAAPGPIGITGYCMGGRLGWRIATAYADRVAALGAFHPGGLATDAEDSPHRSAGDVRAELYLGIADDDPSMTAEQIATLDEALDAAGVRHRTEVYAGAQHGYTMADTAAYDESAAERHYRELFALLERALVS